MLQKTLTMNSADFWLSSHSFLLQHSAELMDNVKQEQQLFNDDWKVIFKKVMINHILILVIKCVKKNRYINDFLYKLSKNHFVYCFVYNIFFFSYFQLPL